ncbi:MAG: rhombosortase [Candidatus Thiodiazotropha sp. (ex Lucinoma aequizonata)]|nr:rhombosortase [Candidatus Thiodiazotropha sp. (ex Lucinoma aequizonata)]MCU7889913.1 rhombosortase [Candidatus Thiodiazotropha sp. (ex Lucinoma aequizonata)]MCU7894416.1 rhombosortase [Candidatus Thiodiazotropha sp. (ex Lucinoma aequizonata)]MCU7899812.1 rhombosortase [Candidatus Thiodiazotropha sp. (ex Lucinoma aequizonata)]MCU7901204.1 rhombosortase [Candidatus Thiodiazotropha sp. (ex Lucinoma aequizonata)]
MPINKNPWWLFLITVVFLFYLTFFNEQINPLFQYQRSAIEQGQWWRFFTPHLSHLNIAHLLLNFPILLIVWWLFFSEKLGTALLLVFFISSSLFCSVGLYLFSPKVTFYVGASGLLYGLLTFALLKKSLRDWLCLFPLAVIIGKVIFEQTQNYDVNYLQQYIHYPVIVDVHLYGVIFGVTFAVGFFFVEKIKSPRLFHKSV